jgi:hypothetical protein
MSEYAVTWEIQSGRQFAAADESSWSSVERRNSRRWLNRRGRMLAKTDTTSVSAREVLQVGTAYSIDIRPSWLTQVWERVVELSRLPRGWDSYGALPLNRTAVIDFFEVVEEFAHAIQGEPAVSLTTDGGLLATWENDSGSLDLVVDPEQAPRVAYEDGIDQSEWYGPVARTPRLEKWLWQTSAAR